VDVYDLYDRAELMEPMQLQGTKVQELSRTAMIIIEKVERCL
jgi:hypothetical protein